MSLSINYRLVAIIALALVLRSVNLYDTPSWDWDEGSNINYATNLMAGHVQYFTYKYHFIPHPPLYFILLAGFFKAAGASILAIRWFSVLCSLISLVFAYLIVKDALDEKYALLAALICAVYPELVFWGRMGFANNLLGAMALSSVYYLLLFIKTGEKRHLTVASLAAGLCPLTEYAGLVFIVSLAFVLLLNRRERLGYAMAVSLAPFMLFIAVMLLSDGAGFVRDAVGHFRLYPLAAPFVAFGFILVSRFSGVFTRYLDSLYISGGKDTPAELMVYLMVVGLCVLPLSYASFFSGVVPSGLFFMSLFGFFLISELTLRRTLAVYIIGYFLMIVFIGRWDHMSIPLIYLMSCTTVFFLAKVKSYLDGKSRWLSIIIITLPIALSLSADVDAYFRQGICTMPVSEVASMNSFINDRTTPDSIVVSFTYFAPLLKARTSVFENLFPYYGMKFAYMSRHYDRDEYAYNLSVENIDYLVVPPGYDTFNETIYGNLSQSFVNWTWVYEVHTRQEMKPSLGKSLLSLAGVSCDCEHHFTVFENPRLRAAD